MWFRSVCVCFYEWLLCATWLQAVFLISKNVHRWLQVSLQKYLILIVTLTLGGDILSVSLASLTLMLTRNCISGSWVTCVTALQHFRGRLAIKRQQTVSKSASVSLNRKVWNNSMKSEVWGTLFQYFPVFILLPIRGTNSPVTERNAQWPVFWCPVTVHVDGNIRTFRKLTCSAAWHYICSNIILNRIYIFFFFVTLQDNLLKPFTWTNEGKGDLKISDI